ncbi:hypothetical protein OUZ56_002368 [Daphnia magna]|uniref:Uncharacterized protein n=1 Tax=Daphnia magna TaxID=35525 RepID=A0ABR0A5R2_9CRUS|nr:hypothetical protein OUZ56_002368 [Daphnia magna]
MFCFYSDMESNLYFTACLADAQPLSHKSHNLSYCFALSFSVIILFNGNFQDYKYNQLQSTTTVPQLVVISWLVVTGCSLQAAIKVGLTSLMEKWEGFKFGFIVGGALTTAV